MVFIAPDSALTQGADLVGLPEIAIYVVLRLPLFFSSIPCALCVLVVGYFIPQGHEVHKESNSINYL